MADPFNPRGSPVPSNSYDGWELTHRPAMLPFLAEYTNPLGETSGGWAMPEMVTEPVNALSRLLNTPAGTMPNPQNPENQRNALTALLSLYGGNALGGMARGAAGRAAGHLGDDLSTFSSINASIFDPPKKQKRAFEEDYPDVTGRHDAQGRLTVDIDGNPLNPDAKYVVGRRVVGGDDEAFSPAEFDAIAKILTGQGAQAVSAREMGRGAGRTLLNRYTGEPLGIELRNNLSAVQSPRVYAHEIGHVIDAHAAGLEGIPQTSILNKELKPLYNSLNNPNRQRLPDGSWGEEAASWAKPVRPETFGYKGDNAPPEYMAEAIRAYMADPNYMKTVAPDTAKRIREYVNSNPRLNKTIQFNADVGKPSAIGSALAGQNDEPWPYIY